MMSNMSNMRWNENFVVELLFLRFATIFSATFNGIKVMQTTGELKDRKLLSQKAEYNYLNKI